MTAPSGDFAPYEILSEIGRGGMGIVYKARDSRDGRIVAIKQLVFANIDPTKEQEFRDRFKREAATAARLAHPNIVTVYDVCVDNAQNYFYVMEILDGHSLRRELDVRGGRVSPKDWWPIFDQAVEGLSFAHSMNVVHRDVKPDNIFILKDGTVKITDFGIARTVDFEQTSLTKTGVMMGTLAYASPEQLQDAKNVDHRADIFSLGVVTYEALAGQVPFSGDGIAQTIVKIVSQEEQPLHILLPMVDVHVSACVSKALRKRARDRYRSVRDFAKEYESALEFAEKTRNNQGSTAQSRDQPFKGMGGTYQSGAPGAGSSNAPSADEMSLVQRIKAYGIDALKVAPPQVDEAASRGISNPLGGPKSPLKNPERVLPVHVFDKYGKDERKLSEPTSLCYQSGRLVVADTASRKLHMFTYDGRWMGDCTLKQTDESKTRGGLLSKPSGIAVDARGRIYACDSSDPYIRVFDSKGVYIKDICNIQGKEGGLNGIAVDSTGLLFVSDMANSCIQVFNSDLGVWMRKIGGKGEAEGMFQLPSGLACDRINQVYGIDYGSARVSIFNKNGGFVRCFGGKGSSPGMFNIPRAVAIDGNDKIYVLDSLNHRIQIFGPTGNWLSAFGGRGSDPGKFIGPSDLSLDSSNNLLYVADKGNQRIQVFELCQI